MIISSTPFRISFAGGGSDLGEFYREEPGHVLSTTINKHMFIAVHPYFEQGKTFIKYSKTEIVDNIKDIQHPIVREVLNRFNIQGIDITSIADILSGTGLGSSSSYTVGLLHALYAYQGKFVSKAQLAKEACEIEIEILKEPIGKQDQYAAAFGGLNFFTFNPDETVNVEPVVIPTTTKKKLESSLLLFYTGTTRSASAILTEQKNNIPKKIASLKKMSALALSLRDTLFHHNLDDFGSILNEGWILKKELASGISNEKIDHFYDLALKNGATGGKLLGAGSGGFLLFFCPHEKQSQCVAALRELRPYKFNFDSFGSRIIYVGDEENNPRE